nr:polysaccharide lyase family 8 super-sandwich domain-containing protein [Listeria fleischmannii]
MFSKRISAFESIGGQNLLGFYTGTGALSIYNGDAALKSNYYPTVDMTSLPGTTTDHKTKSITADNLKYLNPYSWSGGISDQTFGSATMQYSLKNVTGSSLMARKSWFFLNGKIVALGSGISSQENLNTETIVENRQLIHPTNAFSVSGTTLSTGQTKTLSNVKWAYLNGSTQNESMGYVFPAATTVTSYKRVQSGDWKTLNTRNSPSPVSATYAGLRIPHGKAPQNKSYSYILLPGKSKQATEAYSKKMDVEIRANNLNQQAVFDKSQNLWIGNFLQPSSLNGYSAKTRGSMMVKKASGSEKIVISDPSMEQSKVTFLVPQQTGFKLKRKKS